MNLEEAPAPEDPAEGWKADPIGASQWRWWDGTTWTARVGASPASTASAAHAGQAPSKICPNCGAMAQTAAKKCPSCGKGYRKRTGLKIFAGICAAGLVFVIGCSALVIGGVNDAVNELDAQQKEHAITKGQFNALDIGMTEQQVRQSTGKAPEDRQDFESEGVITDEPSSSSCVYYNQADGEFLDSYQLCFDEGRLTSKNSY